MKKSILFIVLFVSAIALFTNSFAQGPPVNISAKKLAVMEDNLLVGLQSDNHGLKVSSAFFLGEIESDRAVIPLMKMFSEEEDPGAKFVAAWSLLKIGDKRGVYRVKRAAERSESNSETNIIEYLYKDFSLNEYGEVHK
ncbi:MAG: hypothetical protein JSW63_02765 [Ignavibacterium sp.]|nr:MAG: hypothetical protein JSW63_02765 [Ignavibacterium sp.]